MRKEIVDRFWSRVKKGYSWECWEWQKGCTGDGYGCFWDGDRVVATHRFAYENIHGSVGDLFILHSCDNRKCCNPNHLRAGTHMENIQDWSSRGNTIINSMRNLFPGPTMDKFIKRRRKQSHRLGI